MQSLFSVDSVFISIFNTKKQSKPMSDVILCFQSLEICFGMFNNSKIFVRSIFKNVPNRRIDITFTKLREFQGYQEGYTTGFIIYYMNN